MHRTRKWGIHGSETMGRTVNDGHTERARALRPVSVTLQQAQIAYFVIPAPRLLSADSSCSRRPEATSCPFAGGLTGVLTDGRLSWPPTTGDADRDLWTHATSWLRKPRSLKSHWK